MVARNPEDAGRSLPNGYFRAALVPKSKTNERCFTIGAGIGCGVEPYLWPVLVSSFVKQKCLDYRWKGIRDSKRVVRSSWR